FLSDPNILHYCVNDGRHGWPIFEERPEYGHSNNVYMGLYFDIGQENYVFYNSHSRVKQDKIIKPDNVSGLAGALKEFVKEHDLPKLSTRQQLAEKIAKDISKVSRRVSGL
ncbi:MAG: hypothetical protein HYT16_00955, partial [DPANN group archaeon]|nr:hypothetical protein [DPANN group archaeon]